MSESTLQLIRSTLPKVGFAHWDEALQSVESRGELASTLHFAAEEMLASIPLRDSAAFYVASAMQRLAQSLVGAPYHLGIAWQRILHAAALLDSDNGGWIEGDL